LFRILDYPLWRDTGHNPVKQLHDISPRRLQEVAADPSFLALYDSVISTFDIYMSTSDTWLAVNHPNILHGPVAYFSMEFAIHNSLPVYAGGLGVLAGDVCKEASDLGLPFVGVGFMYPQGYFHQGISADGWQEETYRQLNFDEAPITPVLSSKGRRPLAQIDLCDRRLFIAAWQVRVGRTNIYLLDADVEENVEQDRQLTARLYLADREVRILQEIILGIGGVRVLRALGIHPTVWHANEGHSAFMMLERLKEEISRGTSYAEALHRVRATTVFTTHTPVPAGHDVFADQLVEKYLNGYWDAIGISREMFFQLGKQDGTGDQVLNMTALALRTAERCNGVSRLNGQVTRKMWHVLWPELREDEVPISHVTNGIHVPTWVAPEMNRLYQKYLDQDWVKRHDNASLWNQISDIPDEELWTARRLLKGKLMGAIRGRAQTCWACGEMAAQQMVASGALLSPETLTIGFVRRFVEYKRPALIFQDIERLKRIVNHQFRPVQIVFAGKSHPADLPAKHLLHEVYLLATAREFQGRIAFVEDYDMHMAHYLVHGVDIWLNNPRRLQEACGSSGMKAALNGVPHLSVLDGWWYEGYNGANGWAIGDSHKMPDQGEEDRTDAEALYRLLEEQIVPLYYNQDRSGVPHGWTRLMKETIRSVVPVFCTRRMLKEYAQRFYIPAALSLKEPRNSKKGHSTA
jgi:starch phosphorylase